MEAEFNVIVTDNFSTPGPGAYNIAPRRKVKGATISPRYHKAEDRCDGSLVALPSSVGKVPRISMGARPKDPKKFVTPGPSYIPPSFGSKSPRIAFPTAKPSKNRTRSPGPADYKPKTVAIGDIPRQASIPHSARSTIFNDVKTNQAPIYSPRYDKVMKNDPSYSIAHRPHPKEGYSEGSELVPPKSTLVGKQTAFPRANRRVKVDHH